MRRRLSPVLPVVFAAAAAPNGPAATLRPDAIDAPVPVSVREAARAAKLAAEAARHHHHAAYRHTDAGREDAAPAAAPEHHHHHPPEPEQ